MHNYAYPTDDPTVNPTGLIYKVTVKYATGSDTAWAANTVALTTPFPGKNWATYFTYTFQGTFLKLYNWYDGTYHTPSSTTFVGNVTLVPTPGYLSVSLYLYAGQHSVTYNILLWRNYGTPSQYYVTLPWTLTTDSNGYAHIEFTLGPAPPGTYVLGIDLQNPGSSGYYQEILTAGSGLYGLANTIVIP